MSINPETPEAAGPKTLPSPHVCELRGACSATGRYDLRVVTSQPVRAKDLRNIARQLELQAVVLDETDTP